MIQVAKDAWPRFATHGALIPTTVKNLRTTDTWLKVGPARK